MGKCAFETIRSLQLLDMDDENKCLEMCLVDEDHIALAILRLVEIEKSIVEGAGASGLAALLSKKIKTSLKGKK